MSEYILMMGDVKQAFRLFAKTPGFTAIVLVTLALGIGANTAVFSVIDGVLLRLLPYKSPDRLIDILDTSPREKELAKIFASYTDFEEFSKHARTLRAPWRHQLGEAVQARSSPGAGRPKAI